MVTVRLVRVRIPRLVPVSAVYLMLRGAGAQAEHLNPLLGSGERLIPGKGLVDPADAPPDHAADSLDVFRDRAHVCGTEIPPVTGEHSVLPLGGQKVRDARIETERTCVW